MQVAPVGLACQKPDRKAGQLPRFPPSLADKEPVCGFLEIERVRLQPSLTVALLTLYLVLLSPPRPSRH